MPNVFKLLEYYMTKLLKCSTDIYFFISVLTQQQSKRPNDAYSKSIDLGQF